MTASQRIVLATLLSQATYEGEPSPGTGGDPALAGGTGTNNPPPPKVKIEDDPQFKTILQRELNRVNAGVNQKNKELVAQLESLKQKEGMTEQEKTDLQSRIDELTATFQTKEEQAKLTLDKVKTDLEGKLKKEVDRADTYRQRFEQKILSVEMLEAAAEYKAFNPQQIIAILMPLTKVEEGTDAEGKPSGQFMGSVNFTGKGSDGKPVQLKLNVKDAVKAMTEMPEQYGNLFRTEANSGLGAMNNNGGTSGRLGDIESMTPQEYAKNRQKILQQTK